MFNSFKGDESGGSGSCDIAAKHRVTEASDKHARTQLASAKYQHGYMQKSCQPSVFYNDHNSLSRASVA